VNQDVTTPVQEKNPPVRAVLKRRDNRPSNANIVMVPDWKSQRVPAHTSGSQSFSSPAHEGSVTKGSPKKVSGPPAYCFYPDNAQQRILPKHPFRETAPTTLRAPIAPAIQESVPNKKIIKQLMSLLSNIISTVQENFDSKAGKTLLTQCSEITANILELLH
jgi:hypothetical protein